jgi:hypothetical protein
MNARQHPQPASPTRLEWRELAEAAILYFGSTLVSLLLVILLYQSGVIA